MVKQLVTDVQQLIDRHNDAARGEAQKLADLIISHPFATMVGTYPATPSMASLGECEDCGGPELAVKDSLSLKPAQMCRDCINGMRRFSLRHKRLRPDSPGANTGVCVDCGGEPREDSHGLVIGPWYHQLMAIEDVVIPEHLDSDGETVEAKTIPALRSHIAREAVSIDTDTNEVTIDPPEGGEEVLRKRG